MRGRILYGVFGALVVGAALTAEWRGWALGRARHLEADHVAAGPALAGRVDGTYAGFESRTGPAAFARTHPGATGEKVVRLWDRYDPDRVFRPW